MSGLSPEHGSNDQRVAAVAFANRASQWATQQHNTSLHQLPLDALTLTEVLRLHLLAAGADNNNNAQWRYVSLTSGSDARSFFQFVAQFYYVRFIIRLLTIHDDNTSCSTKSTM